MRSTSFKCEQCTSKTQTKAVKGKEGERTANRIGGKSGATTSAPSVTTIKHHTPVRNSCTHQTRSMHRRCSHARRRPWCSKPSQSKHADGAKKNWRPARCASLLFIQTLGLVRLVATGDRSVVVKRILIRKQIKKQANKEKPFCRCAFTRWRWTDVMFL